MVRDHPRRPGDAALDLLVAPGRDPADAVTRTALDALAQRPLRAHRGGIEPGNPADGVREAGIDDVGEREVGDPSSRSPGMARR